MEENVEETAASGGHVVVLGPDGQEDVLRTSWLPEPHPREVSATALPTGPFAGAAVVALLGEATTRLVATATARATTVVDDEGYAVRLLRQHTVVPDVTSALVDALTGARLAVVDRSIDDDAVDALAQAAEVWVDLVDWDGETPAPERLLSMASVVVVSDHAIEDPLGVAGDLLKQGRTCVVVTHGRSGATAFLDGAMPVYVPVVGHDGGNVEEQSPAARGLVREAFLAGLARARRDGQDWVPALRAAAELAGSPQA